MTAHRRSFAPARTSKRQGERGQILPMTAIALVAIIAVAADMGYFFDCRRPIKKVALAE